MREEFFEEDSFKHVGGTVNSKKLKIAALRTSLLNF